MVIVALYFIYNVNPIIYKISEAKVKAMATKSVANAVATVLSDNVNYTDIMIITYDNNGNVTTMTANTPTVNMLARRAIAHSQANLDAIGEQGIKIPLGTVSGMPIFTGVGPLINIKINPIGSAICEFDSDFLSAGINQTRHRIFITIKTNISIILPGGSKNVSTTTQVLVVENIIIGRVPDTYLNATDIGDMLNLIPLD